MGCDLKKFDTYLVGQVVHDSATNKVTVSITNPPASCPDRTFTAKNAEIVVQEGVTPMLTYSVTKNRPIVLVPRKEIVQEVEHSIGFVAGLFYVLLAIGVVYVLYKLGSWLLAEEPDIEAPVQKKPATPPPIDSGPKMRSTGTAEAWADTIHERSAKAEGRPIAPQAQPPAPVPANHTTVVNNNNGGGGLVEGMILGEILAGNRSTHTVEREVVREREVPVEKSYSSSSDDSKYSSDSDDSKVSSDSDDSGFSSSKDDSSYSSSDDSSSYSSDSSDSYSSDSSGGGDSYSSD